MIETVEVRWFFEAAPFPPSVFFDKKHLSEPTLDWYACPGGEYYSVKLRNDRVETKLRISTFGAHKFPHAVGRVEHWVKWSQDISEVSPELRDVDLSAAGWIPVEKLRYLRIFTVEGASVREVHCHSQANAQFEWTAVTAADRIWCSIAFDAFGSDSQKSLLANLARVIGFMFKRRFRSGVLTLPDSFGYPKLLQTQAPAGDTS